MNNKAKLIRIIILFSLGFVGFVISFLGLYWKFDAWILIVLFILSAALLALGIFAISKAKIEKPTILEQKKLVVRKKKTIKKTKSQSDNQNWDEEMTDEEFFDVVNDD